MELKITIEDLRKMYEEAFEKRDKEKIKQFILYCLYRRLNNSELFDELLKILELEVKDNG